MKLRHAQILVVFMTIAGFLFAGAVFLILTLPSYREVRALAAQIIEAHTELQAQYASRKHLLTSTTQAAEGNETVKRLGEQFVRPGAELDFITAVEAVAARNGVQERIQIIPNASDPSAPEFKTGFELSFTGPYHAALQAVVDLERLPAVTAVSSVSVRPGGSPTPGFVPPVLISLRGFFAVPPEGL